MENRIQHFLLIGLLTGSMFLFTPTIEAADEVVEPQKEDEQNEGSLPVETQVWDEASKVAEQTIKREKIDTDSIDAYDIEFGVFGGQMSVVDFGTNPVTGFTIAYHVTETIFTQLSYGTTDTEPSSFEIISGTNLLTEDEREYTYYDLSVGFNLLPGESFVTDETVFNSAFYTTIGIGSTDFAGDQRYTATLGLGYRFLFTDWLAMHVEVKDHVFDIDILGEDKTTHNINYTIGITAFF